MPDGLPSPLPKVVICDQDQMVGEALGRILQGHCDVAGVCTNGGDLLLLLSRTDADLVLLGWALPGVSALGLLPVVRQVKPRVKVLVVSMFRDRLVAQAALHAGADGFVPKVAGVGELSDAITRVLSGERYLSPLVPKSSHDVGPAAVHPGLWRLTAREVQVIRLIGRGRKQAEIAVALGLTPNTVGYHVKRIMKNLGIATHGELVVCAVLLEACGELPKGRSRTLGWGGAADGDRA